MNGYDLRQLIDSKCVPCSYFLGCKIQEGYKNLIINSSVTVKDYDKLRNCLFCKPIKN